MTGILALRARLKLMERNRTWWQSDLGIGAKLAFYPQMAASLARAAVSGRKQIRYLGRRFAFDHPMMPLILQEYPHEISRQVIPYLEVGPTPDILDIGGNIGQFAVTFKHFAPGARLDVFEPNPDIQSLLYQNTEGLDDVRIFPFGLSLEPVERMFYEPGRSAIGSLIRDNAGGLLRDRMEVPIQTTNDVASLTGRDSYDLIVVDVEGYEAEVIASLGGIKTRYLHLEVSTRGRSKSYLHSELLRLIHEKFDDFDILCQDGFGTSDDVFYVLLEFTGLTSGGSSARPM